MSCEPYVCPGTYAPADTPIEVLRDLRDKACNVLTPMDRQLLQDFGAYQVHKPIALPTSLPADQRERLLECMKLRAEYDTRYHSGAIGYRPWTADFLCDPQMNNPCYLWSWKPWSWLGVQAIESGLRYAQRPSDAAVVPAWVVSCGMLKDAGKISTAEECEREKANVIEAYIDEQRRKAERDAKKQAQSAMIGQIVMTVVKYIIYAVVIVVGGPAGGAFVAASAALETTAKALQEGRIDAKTALLAVADTVGSLVTFGASGVVTAAVKITLEATKTAVAFHEAIERREELSDALDAQEAKVEKLEADLARVIAARATLEELTAKAKELDAAAKEGQAMLGVRMKNLAIVAGMGLLIAFLLSGRRGR